MTTRYKSILLLTLGMAYAVYSVFVFQTNAEAPVATNEEAKAGRLLFQKYNCIACHQLYGLGGNLGPDIANTAAKGDDYVRAFLKSGTVTMPNFNLTENETNALVEFFEIHEHDRFRRSTHLHVHTLWQHHAETMTGCCDPTAKPL